jgi:hypothetical protein
MKDWPKSIKPEVCSASGLASESVSFLPGAFSRFDGRSFMKTNHCLHRVSSIRIVALAGVTVLALAVPAVTQDVREPECAY